MCSLAASLEYGVPADIMLGLAELEGGKPGLVKKNKNGTHDLGQMQFNSAYLADLEKAYGIRKEDVMGAGCYPFRLAAWRVRGHLRQEKGDIWRRAACYHSKTPEYNTIYRAKLISAARKWAGWIRTHFDHFQID